MIVMMNIDDSDNSDDNSDDDADDDNQDDDDGHDDDDDDNHDDKIFKPCFTTMSLVRFPVGAIIISLFLGLYSL